MLSALDTVFSGPQWMEAATAWIALRYEVAQLGVHIRGTPGSEAGEEEWRCMVDAQSIPLIYHLFARAFQYYATYFTAGATLEHL